MSPESGTAILTIVNSYFQDAVQRVSRLDPGQSIAFYADLLGQGFDGALGLIASMGVTPADRVLENVIGSSYTHRYGRSAAWGAVSFYRLHRDLPDGVRSYVSPDRRDRYRRRVDGLYQSFEVALSDGDELVIQCALHGHRWIKAWFPAPLSDAPWSISEIAETTVQNVEGRQCANCNISDRQGKAP